MKKRIREIVKSIPKCNVFADIGCDHGYCTELMLTERKCQKAIISDISEKCLYKAETLLAEYMKTGAVESILSDGFLNLPDVDVALIAGLGGEEIVSIIKNAKTLPNCLVLQPMKNCDKVRMCVVDFGYKIINDYVFSSGQKFYNLIVSEKGADRLTDEEIEFGRTNLSNPSKDFFDMVKAEIKKCEIIAVNVAGNEQKEILNKLERLKKYVSYK